MATASSTWAEDHSAGAGAEGAEVSAVVITAERSKAAETAPTKASVDETQPESIITHRFIEQATKETGSWVSVTAIAPSISGVTANGGGVGETTKLTMRGFQDGQFNLTYDGISFADTNGPTHHEASYWPSSTVGAVVIDRGPGAAGDLGPSNFGGAIHLFSPEISDTFGGSQRVTYGSFETYAAVTTLNTGTLSQLGGGKLLLNFDERWSAGELSNSGGEAQNQLAKFILPINAHWQLTLLGSHNYTHFYQNDGSGAGATWQQILDHGKNFALTNIPGDEHYYKYNQQAKQSDFEYADLKGELNPSLNVENLLYTYFYKNSTRSASANIDPVGSNASSLVQAKAANRLPGQAASDLQGYDKLNMYRVSGDIVRLNKDFSFGTLKIGGLYEWSTTDRHNLLLDITNGWTPDLKFAPPTNLVPAPTNAKLEENSDWQDYQLFADFYWRPTNNITITPGIKYVHEHLDVRAANENTAGGNKNQSLFDSEEVSHPVYFLTANYKILPYLSVYAQYATSFMFPDITSLYFTNAANGLQSVQTQKTKTYQVGTVYSRGNFTADADAYKVDATNLIQQCTAGGQTEDCNVGTARFSGLEGEAAYAFDFGLTLFANGGSNVSTLVKTAPGVGNPNQELANAPRWTDSVGALFNRGPWAASVTYKQSGQFATYNPSVQTGTTPSGQPVYQRFSLPGYDSIDASASYDFGRFKVKLSGFNLADKRAITSYKPGATATALFQGGADTSYYEFQAGRELQITLQAKF